MSETWPGVRIARRTRPEPWSTARCILSPNSGCSGSAFQLASWSLRPSIGSSLRGRRQSAATSEASISVPPLTISPRAPSSRSKLAQSTSAVIRSSCRLRPRRYRPARPPGSAAPAPAASKPPAAVDCLIESQTSGMQSSHVAGPPGFPTSGSSRKTGQRHRPAQLRPVPGGEREQDQALDGEAGDRAAAPSQSASTPT